jgi:hypothetical protein
MMQYEFSLRFELPADADADSVVERLGAAGCDDALVGIGMPGRIALNFTREARSAEEAVYSAISDVRRAVTGAKLIEAGPDYVGLSDVAGLLEMTRQNMRKLMQSHRDFPPPLYSGSTQVWRLEPLLEWRRHSGYEVKRQLLEVAHVARQCNLAREAGALEPRAQARYRELCA